jgi:hypothetical protein
VHHNKAYIYGFIRADYNNLMTETNIPLGLNTH